MKPRHRLALLLVAGLLVASQANVGGSSAGPLKVLLTYDLNSLGSMAKGQVAIKSSPAVAEWLDGHCGANNWRRIDVGNDVSQDADWVKTLHAKAKTVKQPVAVIQKGTKVVVSPWAADADAEIAYLAKYGGK